MSFSDEKATGNSDINLSIIIPLYNTPLHFFKECLLSIKNANIHLYNYEIIIVNDGSTDHELISFCATYYEEHTCIINKSNSGVSATRNLGMKHAKGDLILFLDSDDVLTGEINNAISFLYNNSNYDLVYSDTRYFGSSKFYYKKGPFSRFRLLYIGNFLSITTLFRKEIAYHYSFDEEMRYGEDYDFWCKISKGGYKFKYLPRPFFYYRTVAKSNSLSQIDFTTKQNIREMIKRKYNPHEEITNESLNEYLLNNFKDKKNLAKLILILFLPGIFNFLIRIKLLKNNLIIG